MAEACAEVSSEQTLTPDPAAPAPVAALAAGGGGLDVAADAGAGDVVPADEVPGDVVPAADAVSVGDEGAADEPEWQAVRAAAAAKAAMISGRTRPAAPVCMASIRTVSRNGSVIPAAPHLQFSCAEPAHGIPERAGREWPCCTAGAWPEWHSRPIVDFLALLVIVEILGPVAVRGAGTVVAGHALGGRGARIVLVALAVAGAPVSAERLARLVW